MNQEISILALSALSIGFFHTILGPDHYLPFVAMSRSRKWSLKKTILITSLSGLGHIGSSIILGFVGIAIGAAISKLEFIESIRGNIAAWFLIIFGFVYLIYGIRQAIKNVPHKHVHVHSDGIVHEHEHTHQSEHTHVHDRKKSLVPWTLFVIFLFGPCEPLIPLLMYPAAEQNIGGVIIVALIFGITTIGTMLGMVIGLTQGIKFIPFKKFERFSHALAGFVILMSGMAIQFLGL